MTTRKPSVGKRELDAYTLRWVHRQALRGRVALPMTETERAFDAALEFIGGKCRDKAKTIESRAKRKGRKR